MDFHGLFRELARHLNKVFSNLDGESERHGGVGRRRREKPVCDGELPDHCAEPLLRRPQVCRLALGST